MATNFYFQSGIPGGRTSEQRLVESLIIESIKIYGFDLYYLPRTEVRHDALFLDDTLAKFENAIPIEAYLEQADGYGGDSELMSKFGIEIRDNCTFMMVRSRWDDVVGAGRSNVLQLPNRPAEGDILFMPMTQSFFEIKKVEAQDPFYQLGKLYTYKIYCELWQYSAEELNTGVADIDVLEAEASTSVSNFEFLLEDGSRLIFDNNATLTEDAGVMILESFNLNTYDHLADNNEFDLEAASILDFTEINPFGEVIRNV